LADNDFTLQTFLSDAKDDVTTVTNCLLEFLIDRDFSELTKDFQNNISEFQKSIKKIGKFLPDHEFLSEINNSGEKFLNYYEYGLTGKELNRKINLFYHSRQIFNNTISKFASEFVGFSKIEKSNERKNSRFFEIPRKLVIIFKELKNVVLRHLDIVNVYLKSLISITGIGELASEFKDSLEAVMRKRDQPNRSIKQIIKQHGLSKLVELVGPLM